MHQDLLEKEATLAQAIKVIPVLMPDEWLLAVALQITAINLLQDLADLKMEVQRQGESAQQMNRRISRLKEDKWSLKNELQVCQVSLQAASRYWHHLPHSAVVICFCILGGGNREKDLILEYLLSVDKVLQTVLSVEYCTSVMKCDLVLFSSECRQWARCQPISWSTKAPLLS